MASGNMPRSSPFASVDDEHADDDDGGSLPRAPKERRRSRTILNEGEGAMMCLGPPVLDLTLAPSDDEADPPAAIKISEDVFAAPAAAGDAEAEAELDAAAAAAPIQPKERRRSRTILNAEEGGMMRLGPPVLVMLPSGDEEGDEDALFNDVNLEMIAPPTDDATPTTRALPSAPPPSSSYGAPSFRHGLRAWAKLDEHDDARLSASPPAAASSSSSSSAEARDTSSRRAAGFMLVSAFAASLVSLDLGSLGTTYSFSFLLCTNGLVGSTVMAARRLRDPAARQLPMTRPPPTTPPPPPRSLSR